MLIQNIYYLCSQKVEEEIGSAGEQPISNKLSALYSKNEGDGILLSLFLLVSRNMAKKTFPYYFIIPSFQIVIKNLQKQPSISRQSYNPLFQLSKKKCHSLIKQTMLQGVKSGHFIYRLFL